MSPTERMAAFIRLKNSGQQAEADELRSTVPERDMLAWANLTLFWAHVVPVIAWFIASEAHQLSTLTSIFFGGRLQLTSPDAPFAPEWPTLEELGDKMAERFRRLDALRDVSRRAARVLGVDANDFLTSSGFGVEGHNVLGHCDGNDLDRLALELIEGQTGITHPRLAGPIEMSMYIGLVEV